MTEWNLSEPIEISDNIHWVGTGAKSFLSRNTFLRVFKGSGRTYNMVIDPGPPCDLEVISSKITSVLGNLSAVNMAFMNHQDPDVVGNIQFFAKLNPQTIIMSTEDTWRLVSLYGLDAKMFMAVERFSNQQATLATGHKLQFVPTPFCHFRGACMLYDLESRILFTGDLFGGIAARGLQADSTNWTGIKAFHQLYMPSNEALRMAVRKIRDLNPAPLVLAPQHGGLIQGELIDEFLDKLADLQVGLDIISTLKEKIPLLVDAVNQIILASQEIVGEEQVATALKAFNPDGTYPSFFALSRDGKATDIKGEPFEAVEALVKMLFRVCDERQKSMLSMSCLKILLERNLPPFDTLLVQEAGPSVEFV